MIAMFKNLYKNLFPAPYRKYNLIITLGHDFVVGKNIKHEYDFLPCQNSNFSNERLMWSISFHYSNLKDGLRTRKLLFWGEIRDV